MILVGLLGHREPSHILAGYGDPTSCWHCDKPTYWVEINFEAPLHPGRCTNAKDVEYFDALRRTS